MSAIDTTRQTQSTCTLLDYLIHAVVSSIYSHTRYTAKATPLRLMAAAPDRPPHPLNRPA